MDDTIVCDAQSLRGGGSIGVDLGLSGSSLEPCLLQEIWNATLKPMQAHGKTLVMLHGNILSINERFENHVDAITKINNDVEERFIKAEKREMALEKRLSAASNASPPLCLSMFTSIVVIRNTSGR
eukprot:3722365-Pyramimonas_sp.AAC.2